MSGRKEGPRTTKTPADFLKSICGHPIVVKLNSGVDYREEYVNDQLKNKYGDAFIRENNVLYISTSKRTLAKGA